MPEFSEQLRAIRREKGLTQSQLADRSGLTREVIAKIETDQRDDLRVSQLVALASALNVAPRDIDARVADAVRPPMTAAQFERVRQAGQAFADLMNRGA